MIRLFRLLSRPSLPVLHALGAVMGWLTYRLSGSYRRLFDQNVAQSGLPPQSARPAIAHTGRMVAEIPHLWLRPADVPIREPIEWKDVERLDAAVEAGKGLVLMTPHIGCFEVVAQAYAERYGTRKPMTALYRPARQPWLRELEETARNRPGLLTAPASLSGVRQMIRALRTGETVGLLPDQVPPRGMGIWAPFFGRPAYTMTLAARLIEQTGAAWLLLVGERLGGRRGFRIHVIEPPEALPPPTPKAMAEAPVPGASGNSSGDTEDAHQAECAAVINRTMEHVIRMFPGQYLWGYNRYKEPRGA